MHQPKRRSGIPAEIIVNATLPHYELSRIDGKAAARKVHVLLMLTLEVALNESCENWDFRKYCLVLAVMCAHSLSESFRISYTSQDFHHDNSYAHIAKSLEQRVNSFPGVLRQEEKRNKKRVVLDSGMSTSMHTTNNIDFFIYAYNFDFTDSKKHQAGRRTCFVYASIFGFSTLRLLAERVVLVCEHLQWFLNVVQQYHVFGEMLPYISCILFGIEILFELSVVIRAGFYGKSLCQKLTKDNRPFRLLYSAVSFALIVCGLLNPIFNMVLLCGFELVHSLFMDWSHLLVLQALKKQLSHNRSDDEPSGILIPKNHQEKLLSALSWKITLHILTMCATVIVLIMLAASILLIAHNPFVCGIIILVAASFATINRFFIILKMSETPGVPRSLENKCLRQIEREQASRRLGDASLGDFALETDYHRIPSK